MDFSQDILTLIPQAPPFVMVDELLFADEQVSRTSLTVSEENIFTQNGYFQEPGLIENIAQTAAAGVGYHAALTNTPPPVGFIGSIKDLKIHSLPKVGDKLQTEVVVGNRIFDVTIISGKVSCNDEVVAECEMKIFLANTKT